MRSFLPFFLLILGIHSVHSQDTINKIDASGRKQGYWIKKDQSGKKIYEGRFQDNIPIGEFKYFYPEGGIKAVSFMSLKGTHAHTVAYFRNGKKNAEGNYLNEKRDSIWRFYSEVDATLVSQEFYKEGKKEGKMYNYYPGEGKAEMTSWKNGIREGPWETYFPNGKVKLKCTYKNELKNGPIQIFFSSGKIMISGQYLNGIAIGTWIYYKESGGILRKETYENGRVIKIDSTRNVRQ